MKEKFDDRKPQLPYFDYNGQFQTKDKNLRKRSIRKKIPLSW